VKFHALKKMPAISLATCKQRLRKILSRSARVRTIVDAPLRLMKTKKTLLPSPRRMFDRASAARVVCHEPDQQTI
jgi:hypothetical protein